MKHLILTNIIILTLVSGCEFKPAQEQLDGQLHAAVIQGNIKKAKAILNKTNDPAALATKYLHVAIVHTGRKKHAEMLKLLVENGGDLNSIEDHGANTITQGLIFSRMTPELLQWCIDNGYDVNLTDKRNRTALAVCMDRFRFEPEQYENIRILIDSGADVNIAPHDSPVLRHFVIFNESTPKSKELLKLLVEAGADLDAKDKRGCTVLLTAIEYGKEDMAELLLEHGASHDTADKYGTTALFKAANMGFVDCVGMLIAQGANVSAVNSGGNTPLRFAISGGNEEIIEMLLATGADVNHIKNGATVLDAADKRNSCKPDAESEADKQKLIKLLTRHGAKRAAELKEPTT